MRLTCTTGRRDRCDRLKPADLLAPHIFCQSPSQANAPQNQIPNWFPILNKLYVIYESRVFFFYLYLTTWCFCCVRPYLMMGVHKGDSLLPELSARRRAPSTSRRPLWMPVSSWQGQPDQKMSSFWTVLQLPLLVSPISMSSYRPPGHPGIF